jgi:hypothetical protein
VEGVGCVEGIVTAVSRGLFRSAVLMVRFTFTTAIIALQVSQILLWQAFMAGFVSHYGTAFYFSTASCTTVDSNDAVLARMWRTLVPVGKRRWRPDVPEVRGLPV